MASEHTITRFPLLPQHSYNSPNLPGLLPKSSQGSLGPTVLLSLLFPVKYGLSSWSLVFPSVCVFVCVCVCSLCTHTVSLQVDIPVREWTRRFIPLGFADHLQRGRQCPRPAVEQIGLTGYHQLPVRQPVDPTWNSCSVHWLHCLQCQHKPLLCYKVSFLKYWTWFVLIFPVHPSLNVSERFHVVGT